MDISSIVRFLKYTTYASIGSIILLLNIYFIFKIQIYISETILIILGFNAYLLPIFSLILLMVIALFSMLKPINSIDRSKVYFAILMFFLNLILVLTYFYFSLNYDKQT